VQLLLRHGEDALRRNNSLSHLSPLVAVDETGQALNHLLC